MKEATLKTLIKNLPTSGDKSGFIRQLAGVAAQKYRDAHRCMSNAKEDGVLAPDTKTAEKHINEQKDAVIEFVEKYGHMTVEQYISLTTPIKLVYKERLLSGSFRKYIEFFEDYNSAWERKKELKVLGYEATIYEDGEIIG